jgi:predicted transcriptional regulator
MLNYLNPKIKSKKDTVEKRFTISEQAICKSILKTFSDDETLKILQALIGVSHTIQEILEKLDIPQTSGYRKINTLIEDGLLIKAGYVIATSGRKVNLYKALFSNVIIDFDKKITIYVQFPQDVLKNNVLLQMSIAHSQLEI